MSYLSTSENVGFSGIPQNIADASCATQYKMAEGVAANCAGNCSSEVNMFIQDSSGDEQSYITHLNDNFFHTKFKIDPNELYTFHDSDVIANEITVSHTEDVFIFPDNVDVKSKLLDSPNKEVDVIESLRNGDIKEEKVETVNGHYTPVTKTSNHIKHNIKDSLELREQKGRSHISKEQNASVTSDGRCPSVQSPKGRNALVSPVSNNKNSISRSNSNNSLTSTSKNTGPETFLDVFKREQGLVENASNVIKIEPQTSAKSNFSTPKKTGKSSSQSKSRRGRGPAVHEALQRIHTNRALPIPIRSWHAPGEEVFECGPLVNRKSAFKQIDSSSSDDDNIPEFESASGPVCVEETAAESRGARLALRRAALRRHVARVDTEMRFADSYKDTKSLATLIKKQINSKGSNGNLPVQTVNHLLALRGMPALLSSNERRQLRETGWSGGESGAPDRAIGACCAEENCTETPLPCGRYCLKHVTLAPEQRLYAACAAVFAGGARCKQPLLPLQDQTPLCPEHAWKRHAEQPQLAVTSMASQKTDVQANSDNYDKLTRDCRPKPKPVRKRIWAAPVRPPRRAKRRRRPPVRPRPPLPTSTSTAEANPPQTPLTPTAEQSLSEINVCSNSSAYDSSEDAAMGTLSENEYIVVASDSHELEEVEVEQVPHDDILDPSVLSQMPDEAFTEFFNQVDVELPQENQERQNTPQKAEGANTFSESSELTAALEAVLDERGLEERVLEERVDESIDDSVFVHSPHAELHTKIQVPASVPVEMSTSGPS